MDKMKFIVIMCLMSVVACTDTVTTTTTRTEPVPEDFGGSSSPEVDRDNRPQAESAAEEEPLEESPEEPVAVEEPQEEKLPVSECPSLNLPQGQSLGDYYWVKGCKKAVLLPPREALAEQSPGFLYIKEDQCSGLAKEEKYIKDLRAEIARAEAIINNTESSEEEIKKAKRKKRITERRLKDAVSFYDSYWRFGGGALVTVIFRKSKPPIDEYRQLNPGVRFESGVSNSWIVYRPNKTDLSTSIFFRVGAPGMVEPQGVFLGSALSGSTELTAIGACMAFDSGIKLDRLSAYLESYNLVPLAVAIPSGYSATLDWEKVIAGLDGFGNEFEFSEKLLAEVEFLVSLNLKIEFEDENSPKNEQTEKLLNRIYVGHFLDVWRNVIDREKIQNFSEMSEEGSVGSYKYFNAYLPIKHVPRKP